MIYFIMISTIFRPMSQVKKRQMYRGLFDGVWAPNEITNDFNKDDIKGHIQTFVKQTFVKLRIFLNFKKDMISNKYYLQEQTH